MIENLPGYVNGIFILTVFITLYLFYHASGKSKPALILILIWLAIQGVAAYTGFYLKTDNMPPRFMLAVIPAFIFIALLFGMEKGRIFLDKLDVKTIIYIQTVRIPVEIVLYLLSIYKAVPVLMTFAGRNFDIIAGLTAPFIAYFGFTKKTISRKIILAWNIIGLCLLFNIVTTAALSAPFMFQQFAFDRPNIAVLYFPFIWLPSFIVPVALLCHLLVFKQYKNIDQI